jgi:hypothetical protein
MSVRAKARTYLTASFFRSLYSPDLPNSGEICGFLSQTHSPLRISGSTLPVAVIPSKSISLEPIIQST